MNLEFEETAADQFQIKFQSNGSISNARLIYLHSAQENANQLPAVLNDFINHQATTMIINLRHLYFGIRKCQNWLYLFNFRSCTEKGNFSKKGNSCLIAIKNTSSTIDQIIKIIGNFSKRFFDLKRIEDDFIVKYVQVENIMQLNAEREFKLESESVMTLIEHNEPDVETAKNMIKEADNGGIFNLNRKTTKPLNAQKESKLEELSFVKLFPYGKGGYRLIRKYPFQRISIGRYSKIRVLSKDSRFQNNLFMFYALALLESENINSKLNVCGKRMRSKETFKNNLHVYVKG
jgi:hypothetical protein